MFQKILKKIKNGTLTSVAVAGFVIGTPSDDILSDAGKFRDFIYAESGNDVLVYTPSINQDSTDVYDGGVGMDTLWLRLSEREYERADVRSDLIGFFYHILNNADVSSPSKEGAQFHFQAFGLQVSNIENVMIEQVNSRDITVNSTLTQEFMKLKDTSKDSLT